MKKVMKKNEMMEKKVAIKEAPQKPKAVESGIHGDVASSSNTQVPKKR